MLHYHKQNGFIILVVLVFMQIFILLNWYAIENIVLLLRESKNSVEQERIYEKANHILSRAESSVISHSPECVIPIMYSSQMVRQPLTWWAAKSCSGNFQGFKYYYVVEPLARDSCAIVDRIKKISAAYFRITVFLYSDKEDARIFLQSTLVKPDDSSDVCKSSQHSVQTGRQSWREL